MRILTETRVWQFLLCCGLLLCGASTESRAQEKATTDECIEVASKVKTADEDVDTAQTQDLLFPGGFAALQKYLRDNMEYPQAALAGDVQGLVILRFAVETDGSIGDVQIKKSLSFECDREAIRVVKSLPRFISAKVNGVPVRKWITIPFRFIIQ